MSQSLKSNCDEIAFALKKSKTPYLESYFGQAWPADMLMCIASLSLYDDIFIPRYESDLEIWLDDIKGKLDLNGLIPHSVDHSTGFPKENARGASQSLMLNFLPEIDEDFTKNQFKKYKDLFKTNRFGLPGIRHYPKGVKGRGDIDSGPVILGIGGAASIVGQRTYGKQKDWETYEGLRNSIESFGMGFSINSRKRYIFGQLPMADAFICWSNSIENKKDQITVSSNWRIPFHFLSILIILLIFFVLKRK